MCKDIDDVTYITPQCDTILIKGQLGYFLTQLLRYLCLDHGWSLACCYENISFAQSRYTTLNGQGKQPNLGLNAFSNLLLRLTCPHISQAISNLDVEGFI